MLKVTQQIHDAINEFQMYHIKYPTAIYISCNLLSVLIEEMFKGNYTAPNPRDYPEDYLKIMKVFTMRYLDIPVYRIVDDGHIVVK